MVATRDQTHHRSAKALSEIELQDRIIASLPEGFKFPLFNGRQALESQRKSAYRSTPRAAREIADNSHEAGADNLWIIFQRPEEKSRSKHERRDAVCAIAFIDNGPGMSPEMARYALSWGGGTRFENPKGIGRFGFGLPNSSINQTRRVEVYTRRRLTDPWIMACLDITPERLKAIEHTDGDGYVNVDPPTKAPLPTFVADYIKQNKIALDSGTIVVWEKPDRLSARSASALREMILDDFGVTYRYLLDKFTIFVDGKKVEKVDPLFLTPGARYYLPMDQGGAQCPFEKPIPVRYSRDPETGDQELSILGSMDELRAAREAGDGTTVGVISVRIARFPYGFASERVQTENGSSVDTPKESDAYKRLQIRKGRTGISYVRALREVDYVDNLPTRGSDAARGLGKWPTLESYAYHWAIEVTFQPELDDAFGIGNDKQSVSPIEDVWRVLSKAEVDKQLQEEDAYQRKERRRKKHDQAQLQAADPINAGPVTDAAMEADKAIGAPDVLPEDRATEARERYDDTVKRRSKETGQPADEVAQAIKDEAARKKYGIEFFDAPGGVFFEPDFGNGYQRIARVNTNHPFFKFFYGELINLPNPRPRQAVEMLLLALAKGELESVDLVKTALQHQREAIWSPFLKAGLGILDQIDYRDYETEDAD